MPLACGDDADTDTGAETNPIPGTGDDTSSSGADPGSSSGGADTGSGTAAVDDTGSSGPASTDDATTGGPSGDPEYPPPVSGDCPVDTLPVMLPGASICAPFCGGPDDACPAAATGDATPQCTPFAGAGGSGNACSGDDECPDGELCDDEACVTIAFYACQLRCDMGETCPDAMTCSGIATCGYR